MSPEAFKHNKQLRIEKRIGSCMRMFLFVASFRPTTPSSLQSDEA